MKRPDPSRGACRAPRKTVAVVACALLAGCSSAGTPPPAAPAATPTPAPTKVVAPPVPASDPTELARQQKVEEMVRKLAGGDFKDAEKLSGEYKVVKDPKTGQDQHQIPKSRQYYELNGRLYNNVMKDKDGLPILRSDEGFWYVPVPATVSEQPSARAEQTDEVRRSILIDIPKSEAEVVSPPLSASKLRFRDESEGLPSVGMWRENLDVGDLDGDGRPEIVTPPPRLSGREMQIYKWDGKGRKWNRVEAAFDDTEKLGYEYGGVALGDMDGDGKTDILFGAHGSGPRIAFNKGAFKFRIESRGLPKKMSTRSMAIGDLNGDGKMDFVAQSDEPEYSEVKRLEAEGKAAAHLPGLDGYILGNDTRAFLSAPGGKYEEVRLGLDETCFGYNIGLFAPAPDKGKPFSASSCRYASTTKVVLEYDAKANRFTAAGTDIVEAMAIHIGTALGTYMGHPASFHTYTKNSPQGSVVNATGNGVSIYYRDGETWKRKRLVKSIAAPLTSEAIAVGDLNGDGLDDVAYADDSVHRVRIFLQLKSGEFEELAVERQPTYVNHGTSARIADVDGDRRNDIILMYQYLTGDSSRAGGLMFFRNEGAGK